MVSKIYLINSTNLSTINKKRLIEHSKHHSLIHIKYMIKLLKSNETFNYAHIKAMEMKGR